MPAEDERAALRAAFQHPDGVRPAVGDDFGLDIEAAPAHLGGHLRRDGCLAWRAGHERRIDRIDRDEIAEQTDGGIHY